MLRFTTPPLHTYKRTANFLGWALVLFVPLFYLFTGGIEGIFSMLPMHNAFIRLAYGALSTVAYIAPFVLTGLFYYLLTLQDHGIRATARTISVRPRMVALMPLLILASLAINLLASYANATFCEWIGYTIPDELYILEGYDDPGAVILYMTTAIAPAFAEEFLFRGVVYANLRPFGRWQAILISAMTFSLMHENVAQIFYTFVCGILLALMYEYTGSVWCGVVFHLLNNQLSGVWDILLYGRYGEDARLYLEWWDAAVVVLGLISLIGLAVYALILRITCRKAVDGGPQTCLGLPVTCTEHWDAPVAPSTAARALLTPGLITFTVLEMLTILLDYGLVLLTNWGGGFL